MAKIEDLIGEIADARLRDELARAVASLKREKKFGLVFEEHIPEQVLLPGLPVKAGLRVAKRGESIKTAYLVEEVHANGKVRVRPEAGDGESETVKTKDLLVVKRFGEPIYPTLTPVARITRGEGKPYHAIVNADNFHALQLFLYCYAGQVDVIYIDPPYNTGARDWKYNNDYVDANDQWRHSKWLSMMKKRLTLARRLLKPGGILVVAIDDCEMHHLRCLLEDNEVWSSRDFLGCIVVRSKPSGNQTEQGLAVSHEYAFYLGRDKSVIHQLQRSEQQLARFDQEDDKGRFWWENLRRGGANSRRVDRPKMFYPIWVLKGSKLKVPAMEWQADKKTWKVMESLPANATEIWPKREGKDERIWSFGPDRARSAILSGEIKAEPEVLGFQICRKRRMNRPGILPTTVWTDKRFSATEYGTNILAQVLGAPNQFSYPKSLYTVIDCIRCATDNPNALIVDFFAGSATTYHATALLNAEDGGSRRCLLVTNNEVSEKTARELHAKGHFPGDAEFEKHGICESVTWPRCKYVTQGHRDDGTPLPGSYLDGGDLKDGFDENLEYFRLDFLDPHEVAYGDRFEAMLPILWLMAGAKGERENVRGRGKWFIPKQCPYAVLIQEETFAEFKRELTDRPDITLVFLVTDSEEAFREMSAALPGRTQTKMLYKSYLDNFKINQEAAL